MLSKIKSLRSKPKKNLSLKALAKHKLPVTKSIVLSKQTGGSPDLDSLLLFSNLDLDTWGMYLNPVYGCLWSYNLIPNYYKFACNINIPGKLVHKLFTHTTITDIVPSKSQILGRLTFHDMGFIVGEYYLLHEKLKDKKALNEQASAAKKNTDKQSTVNVTTPAQSDAKYGTFLFEELGNFHDPREIGKIMGNFKKEKSKSCDFYEWVRKTNADDIRSEVSAYLSSLPSLARNTGGVARNTGGVARNTGGVARNTEGVARNTEGVARNTGGVARNIGTIKEKTRFESEKKSMANKVTIKKFSQPIFNRCVVYNPPAGEARAANAPAGEARAANAPAGEARADNAPAGEARADNAPAGEARAANVPIQVLDEQQKLSLIIDQPLQNHKKTFDSFDRFVKIAKTDIAEDFKCFHVLLAFFWRKATSNNDIALFILGLLTSLSKNIDKCGDIISIFLTMPVISDFIGKYLENLHKNNKYITLLSKYSDIKDGKINLNSYSNLYQLETLMELINSKAGVFNLLEYGEAYYAGIKFADCMETTLRNIFNVLILFTKVINLDILADDFKNYFINDNKDDEYLRNAWAEITSNIPGIDYANKYYNMEPSNKNFYNILALAFKLCDKINQTESNKNKELVIKLLNSKDIDVEDNSSIDEPIQNYVIKLKIQKQFIINVNIDHKAHAEISSNISSTDEIYYNGIITNKFIKLFIRGISNEFNYDLAVSNFNIPFFMFSNVTDRILILLINSILIRTEKSNNIYKKILLNNEYNNLYLNLFSYLIETCVVGGQAIAEDILPNIFLTNALDGYNFNTINSKILDILGLKLADDNSIEKIILIMRNIDDIRIRPLPHMDFLKEIKTANLLLLTKSKFPLLTKLIHTYDSTTSIYREPVAQMILARELEVNRLRRRRGSNAKNELLAENRYQYEWENKLDKPIKKEIDEQLAIINSNYEQIQSEKTVLEQENAGLEAQAQQYKIERTEIKTKISQLKIQKDKIPKNAELSKNEIDKQKTEIDEMGKSFLLEYNAFVRSENDAYKKIDANIEKIKKLSYSIYKLEKEIKKLLEQKDARYKAELMKEEELEKTYATENIFLEHNSNYWEGPKIKFAELGLNNLQELYIPYYNHKFDYLPQTLTHLTINSLDLLSDIPHELPNITHLTTLDQSHIIKFNDLRLDNIVYLNLEKDNNLITDIPLKIKYLSLPSNILYEQIFINVFVELRELIVCDMYKINVNNIPNLTHLTIMPQILDDVAKDTSMPSTLLPHNLVYLSIPNFKGKMTYADFELLPKTIIELVLPYCGGFDDKIIFPSIQKLTINNKLLHDINMSYIFPNLVELTLIFIGESTFIPSNIPNTLKILKIFTSDGKFNIANITQDQIAKIPKLDKIILQSFDFENKCKELNKLFSKSKNNIIEQLDNYYKLDNFYLYSKLSNNVLQLI